MLSNNLGLKSEASLLRHAWVVSLVLYVQLDGILGHTANAFGEVAHCPKAVSLRAIRLARDRLGAMPDLTRL
jgi:hypothetical protein